NTRDEISFGVLKSILVIIENTAKNKKIYFTGGDGKFLSRFFKNCIYDNLLIFKGMQNVISEKIMPKGTNL
ncbi:MAG: pantothenate kinase, partial [Helicobacter sp.]|nr:pantothenate kinase [Helicobacter sp.]